MGEAVNNILEEMLAGFFGYAIGKILDQYMGVPLILEVKLAKRKGMAHEYTGKKLVHDYWRDLLGKEYGLFPDAKKVIETGHLVTFKDVVVTDFVPRAPGFYYSKTLWDNPKLAPISLGVIRVIPNEQTGSRRLLAIHKPSEFEAHAEIEKGIPIVVSEEVYKRIGKSLQECGSAHVNEIVAIMSDVGDHSEYLKMIDMPYTFPLVEKENYITEGGDPVPIMGNGWVVYETPDTSGFSHFRFWAGVDYHKKNLQEAKEALEKLIPGNGWAITNFDELVQHWKDAPLQLSRAWEYIRLLGKRKATIDKS